MIILLNDHKTGFVLSGKIIGVIQKFVRDKIEIRTYYILNYKYNPKNKYIIMMRNPKEIIISGYLYNKTEKVNEKWCREVHTNESNFFYTVGEMKNKQEEIKKNYKYYLNALNFSKPIPYQEKLNKLNQTDGILHEMNNVAFNTIMGLYSLEHFNKPNTIFLKMEDLIFNHSQILTNLCSFLNINKVNTLKIIDKCIKFNLFELKKKNDTLEHCTNKNIVKDRYKLYWNEQIENEFKKIFPKDIMEKFNY